MIHQTDLSVVRTDRYDQTNGSEFSETPLNVFNNTTSCGFVSATWLAAAVAGNSSASLFPQEAVARWRRHRRRRRGPEACWDRMCVFEGGGEEGWGVGCGRGLWGVEGGQAVLKWSSIGRSWEDTSRGNRLRRPEGAEIFHLSNMSVLLHQLNSNSPTVWLSSYGTVSLVRCLSENSVTMNQMETSVWTKPEQTARSTTSLTETRIHVNMCRHVTSCQDPCCWPGSQSPTDQHRPVQTSPEPHNLLQTHEGLCTHLWSTLRPPQTFQTPQPSTILSWLPPQFCGASVKCLRVLFLNVWRN